jgi:GMP reductase
MKTGVGMPQLSAIIECADAAHGVGGYVIGDGGITCPGDMAKAFGGGADFVMCGGVFSGHDENPGEITTDNNGNKFKLFYGMSSQHAMEKHYGKMEKYRSSEGRVIKVKYRGSLEDTVTDYLGGLRSCCTYINAKCIKHMPKCTTFVRVSQQLNTSLV